MAGPSIVVRVLGDLKQLGSSFSEAGDKAQGAAQRGAAAFHSFLGGLNATGALGPMGPLLDTVDQGIQRIAEHGAKLGPAMAGAGAAMAGAGAALTAFGSKEQASHQQLQQAIENTGKSYDDYGGAIDKAISKGEGFGKTSAQTQDALRILTQATHDPKKAIDDLGIAFNLSAAKHEDLSTAATQLGRTFNGNAKLLKEFGITAVPSATQATKDLERYTKLAQTTADAHAKAVQHLADVHALLAGKSTLTVAEQIRLRDAQAAVAATADKADQAGLGLQQSQDLVRKTAGGASDNIKNLSGVLKGQAAAAADTFGGRVAAIKTKIEDAVSAFGQKYGPAIQGIGVLVLTLGSIWTAVGPLIAGFELATMWPILLIVAAVVALIAIGVLLWKNWDTVWSFVKDAIKTVWDWIKNNWPLLLDILLGPIGIAVSLIITHWDEIKAGAAAVVQFITDVWNTLVGFFTGVAGTIGGIVSGLWDGIVGAANWAIALVKGGFNDLVGFFTGMPGRIANAASGMWDGIWNAFRGAINLVIGAWDSLHFTIGGGSVFGVDIPSFTFATPHIDKLATGGIVTRPTLALLGEAGPEAVIPLGARMAPAVNIEHAHFETELDVELFMRRAAWVAQTSRI
jgi:hypothetical protein